MASSSPLAAGLAAPQWGPDPVYGLVAGFGSAASWLSPSVLPAAMCERAVVLLARLGVYLVRTPLRPGAGQSG
jgi:hypothetical protein